MVWVCEGKSVARGTRSARAWGTSARAGGEGLAPTIVHGTGRVELVESGPLRFWDAARIRRIFFACMVLSMGVHYGLSPWNFLPKATGIEFKDVEDDLTIPVDLLGEEAPAPAVDPAATRATPGTQDPTAGGGADAGPADAGQDATPVKKDAGLPLVASGVDGGALSMDVDGGADLREAGVADASGEELDGSLLALAEAGTPRAPPSPGGLASIVQGGEVNVNLLLNMDVIRQHPVGARIGPLLSGIPQWNEFIHGAETGFDPLKHTNWVHIYGPSLIHTDRDAVHVHLDAPDDVIDKAIDLVSRRAEKGGPFDAGVPGVRAMLGYGDNAQRVIMRVRSKEVVIVPPAKAHDFAVVLKARPVRPDLRAGEALRVKVMHPSRQIAIPQLKVPASLKEFSLWILPRAADGGADLYAEGECTDEQAARDIADGIRDLVNQQKASMAVRLATRGLLNNVEIVPDGSKVRLHVNATREQLDALLSTAALQMGVQLPQPPAPPAP